MPGWDSAHRSGERSIADTLVLFGATGDLARRMLLPSLFALHADGLLPAGFAVVGTARSDLDADSFRNLAATALTEHLPPDRQRSHLVPEFLQRLSYVRVDVSHPEDFARLAAARPGRRAVAVFLSTAPTLFGQAIAGLGAANLGGDQVRIAVEKPLGTDSQSSRAINDAIAALFPEERTFRIDHYLGKETVQNLLALRFGNVLFEPLWNAQIIGHVQISVAETVGVEGRGEFYDATGALRDMVQNHVLQLLALVAMEPPAKFDAGAVRDEKVKVLRSLRPIDRTTVASHSVIGQYGPGMLSGQPALGYADELGKPSVTETFVALKAHIDNWRWKGVPFYLRTGKKLATRLTEIAVQFKPVPHSIFAERGGELHANKMYIRLQPEEDVRLLVMNKVPGLARDGMRLREVPLDLSLTHAFAGIQRRIAYERLLLDFIEGDPTLFVRRDEVEAQWAWIDNIRDGWAWNEIRPRPYPAGSWGPSAAIALTERDGVSWHE